jgi:NADH dehydrogenase
MILIAGGTGTLGTPLVDGLVARGAAVRVLTRHENRAIELRARGIEAVVGDVRDTAAIATAVVGCATVISAIQGFSSGRGNSPASIDRDANIALIDAVIEAGGDHLILVSAYGASPTHPMSLHRMKFAAEQALRSSSLHWTIIRPTAYLETWSGLIGAQLPDRGRALVFGPGDNPINFVSVTDVVAAVEHAVYDDTQRDRIIEVVGSEDLTFNQIAGSLTAAIETPTTTDHIPLFALRALSILARPIAPAFARKAHAAAIMNTTNMSVDRTGAAPAR